MNDDMQDPNINIMELSEAIKWRYLLNKKKLVITNGCFDLLHRGHVEYLYKARMHGDALLILLNSDSSIKNIKGSSRPIISEQNRAYLLASLRFVNAVVVFDEPRCTHAIDQLKPQVYVKGGDYTLDTLNSEERTALRKHKTNIVFIPFIHGFSTTDIIHKIHVN